MVELESGDRGIYIYKTLAFFLYLSSFICADVGFFFHDEQNVYLKKISGDYVYPWKNLTYFWGEKTTVQLFNLQLFSIIIWPIEVNSWYKFAPILLYKV